MTVRPQVWVGIDVGKLSHHACAVDETGKVVWTQKLANEQRAIETVIERAHTSAERVQWAIDLTSPIASMLITVLLAVEETVVYVPGRVVNTMTNAFRGEGKTDAKDARVIAQIARMRTDLADVTMPDDLVVELTQLTGDRTDVMADWVRGINRLRSLLGSIFPALEAAFDYSTRTPLILVAGLCTPEEIRAAGTERVTAHLQANKAWAPGIAKTATTAVALANAQHLVLPGQNGTAALVKRIAAKLLDLDREIKDLDKTIAERFRDHPYARIIESLPGFGPNLGAEFLVVTRGDLASFGTAGRLASYAGLVPVPQDSGRVSGNLRRPKRFNRRLRRVFYLAALSSLRTGGPSRQFYDRKRGERLVHSQALLALARRLVDVLWALLRDGREFTLDKPALAAA
ncbi:IS110 family RNA-guided transposase [Mycolicibacterium sarraceniae]|uniref:IS110 family transposase n=1 Tax=Mycolicibacterium sarraceniae TaxID=1534348 RepID=A0A7I7SQU2_9MYCO|nr:IS110 family transposase [Mycolicibacterium sarraceniae]BBY59357.1 IS110 family transposase [Mycolicibacterium sarraceniae]